MNTASQVLRMVAALWVVLGLLASGITGVVLCISADGHVALEVAHQGDCRDGDDHGEPDTRPVFHAATGPPCVDVSLSSSSAAQLLAESRRLSPGMEPPSGAPPVRVGFRTGEIGGPDAPSMLRARREASTSVASMHQALRTVVLRT